MTNPIQPKPLSPEQREEIERLRSRSPAPAVDRTRFYMAHTRALLSHIAYLEEENRRMDRALTYAVNALDDVWVEREAPLNVKVQVNAIMRGQTHQEGIESPAPFSGVHSMQEREKERLSQQAQAAHGKGATT